MKNNNDSPCIDIFALLEFDFEIRKCPHCDKVINEIVVVFPIKKEQTLRKDSKEEIDYSCIYPDFLCPECYGGSFVFNEEEALRFLNLPEQ